MEESKEFGVLKMKDTLRGDRISVDGESGIDPEEVFVVGGKQHGDSKTYLVPTNGEFGTKVINNDKKVKLYPSIMADPKTQF